MTDLRQAGVPVPKFRSPRPECRWEKADDGALVMAWSVAAAAPPALRVVGGNPKAGRYLTLISFTSAYATFP
jgi:hypothetical protein